MYFRKKVMLPQAKMTSPILNKKGQASIFLGVATLVIMSLMAFVANVGLYVKAKIQLQNAVDAAAFAGASVQARQLSQLAYINWEMRNTYKEWMFKYYILGQASLPATYMNNIGQGSSTMNFRRPPFTDNPNDPLFEPDAYGKFNVPSICIAFSGEKFNMCGIHTSPGLPRLNEVGVPGLSELNEATINSFVKTQTQACANRSMLNFAAGLTWAFGTGKATLEEAPTIAANRPGAWPQALELGLRMRNLEMIINRPPVESPICSTGNNCVPVSELRQESPLPINARSIKAFESAWRNLGGPSPSNNELQQNFKLTEISPNPYNAGQNSVSGMLIPGGATIGQTGTSALTKHYVDMQLYPLNLVTFFTTFVAKTGTFGENTEQHGNCSSSLTAIPVPAYLFGFVKNPEVLTYYSVKGETKFKGLFYPFTEEEGITITAYASAKPYGGRIGPRLFSFANNDQAVTPRKQAGETRTAPYVSGFDTSLLSDYKPGDPVPITTDFWVTDTTSIGGIPQNEVKFGIPNLLYEFPNSVTEMADQANTSYNILSLLPALSMGEATGFGKEQVGLYSATQFELFANNLQNEGGAISSDVVLQAIQKVRSPTRYEALNYLIPTTNNEDMEAPDTAINLGDAGNGSIKYDIYAPLFGPGTLYPEINSLEETTISFIDANQNAIQSFENALKKVSDSIRSQNTGEVDENGNNLYAGAADSLHNGNLDENDCDKMSLAGKFHKFFGKGVNEPCGIVPLIQSIKQYFSNSQDNSSSFKDRYVASYLPSSLGNETMMTAYIPGPRQGSTPDGKMNHPFFAIDYSSRRNYYSTKFVATEKLSGQNHSFLEISPYREKSQSPPGDLNNLQFKNTLQVNDLSMFKTLEH